MIFEKGSEREPINQLKCLVYFLSQGDIQVTYILFITDIIEIEVMNEVGCCHLCVE